MAQRKYALGSESLKDISTETLELLHELHDLRDTKTAIIAREEEIRERIISMHPVPVNGNGQGRLDMGIARVNSRMGSEFVDRALLRDKLGEEAETFIYRRDPVITITHLDPSSIEAELHRRSL